MNKMKEKEEVEDVGSASSDSFIDDLDDDDDAPLTAEQDQGSLHSEAPLTEAEIDELVADLLEVESKAAEAQESLEKESLARVESEVREELAENLQGDLLELAVRNEMRTFVEEWETTLDELETESAHLLEQLDGSGIDLPNLYKWIESQAPSGCSTETWRKRTHWVGSQITSEISESIMDAEKFLQSQRPVRRKRGKLLEEGASGFLGRKVAMEKNTEALADNQEKDWRDFDEVVQPQRFVEKENAFGGKHWASVYLASTPQQAANLGLELPGIDEVEEIDDIEGCDPFYADAIANEKEIDLSEEQKKSFRKVNAEDDEIMTRKLHLRLKRRRNRIRSKQECIQHEIDLDDRVAENDINDCIPSNENSQPSLHNDTCVISADFPNNGSNDTSQILETELPRSSDSFNELHSNKLIENGNSLVVAESTSSDLSEPRGEKRSHDSEDEKTDTKRSRTVVIDSDDEVHADEDKSTSIGDDNRLGSQFKSVNVDSPHSLNVIDTSENFQCTACSKVMGASVVHQHPLLKVIVCANCKTMIEEKMQEKDPDCSECYCGWCGRSNDLISCKACKLLFCLMCIKCNFGEECLSQFQASGWHCFGCSPSILQGLTVECEKALAAKRVLVSSSESDSEVANSISDSTKKRRKKKIRRILDDAELGEETKQKIAIEKARQEHLKTLKVQITAKSNICDTEACIGNETASVDVLGDVTHGYIVNVVREKDEEPVRIPPSVSVKLKPHQIKGIRFMWENIIQSVRKVRLGDKGLGCILAHTMGLGKTFQVISFLYTSMRGAELGLKCALVVTPVNVLHNWRQEFVKWKPLELKALRIFMLDDVPSDKRLDLFKKWRRKGGVFLIGYTAFRNLSLGKHVKDKHVAREICHALQDGPDILVCDEAHMIKNTRADTTHALKQVKCQRRIALTGSPLQNNLMEYYCMVDFVREGFLGSSHEFRNRFQNPIENGQHANATSYDVKVMNQRSHILYEQLKGFVQRMDMNVVKKDLPPKTVYVISVKLSPLQRKLYKKFLDVHGFTSDKVSGEKVIRKSCFFAGYQALAQIWSHPGLLQMAKEHRDHLRGEDAVENFLVDDISSDDNAERDALTGDKQRTKNDFTDKKSDDVFLHKDWWKDLLHEKIYKEVEYSGKMVLLLDILSMSSEVGDKALVFSQSLTTLDLIEFYLSKLPRHGKEGRYWKQGKDWYRLDGSTAGSERQKMVEKFNEPLNTRVKCTLISTRAGSLGINLYAANRVIIVDGSWNPTHDLQAIYRVWRYGQKKPVYAYRLMAHGTMEEKIYKRQVTKEGLAARVVDKQQIHRTMSKEEMLHLFDFGDDENSDADGAIASQCAMKQDVFDQAAIPLKQRLPNGTLSSSDRLMERLLNKHYPRWMANYHEHETLLQENEEEKLSKEEQDMAWEMFQRNTEWEEVQKVPVVDDSTRKQQPVGPVAAPDGSSDVVHNKGILRNQCMQRKCTNLSHMLTLRSQGTKHGCSTICGECAQEITWEGLNRHGK